MFNVQLNVLSQSGGESGIRTHDTASRRIHTFQACAFNRSAISPVRPKRTCKVMNYLSEIKIFNQFFSCFFAKIVPSIAKLPCNILTNKHILLLNPKKFFRIFRCDFANFTIVEFQKRRQFFGNARHKSRLIALSTMRNRG